jgi:4'-phosphopantetheinyl transferase
MSLPDKASSGQVDWRATHGTSPALQWPLVPETIRLEPGQAHLWAAALNEFEDEASKLGVLLSSTEQARAEKFKFVEGRNRYVIRHGLLRLILSRYLAQLPSAIEFQHGAYGKPEIRSDVAGTTLFFNTSHSAEVAIFAITSACPIGVDVERTREIPKIEEIVRRFFLPREIETLMALPPDSRLPAFYAGWTRKESFLKATGEGIAQSLAKVEVTLAPDDEPGVVSVSGDRLAHEQWQLQPFSPAPGYLGCVAYRNAALALSQWRVAKSIV